MATRPNAAIFQVIANSFAPYDLGQITRSADLILEEYLDLITTDPQWLDYVRRATGESSRLEYVFETWNSRLKSLLSSQIANDSQRIFSAALKDEMFQQNQTCALCNQKIHLIRDAALDHNLHYWRGGQTIPDNARLVHRMCNFQREK